MRTLKSPSRQYQVGQSGYYAFRKVRKGGIILWLKHRYQSDTLLIYVGQDVFLWDCEESIQIHEGGFDALNRPIQWGKWICTLGDL
jgi:hypothetical protein